MNYMNDSYKIGYSDGRNEVFCNLLCCGFDEKLLQRIFAISDYELSLITSQANETIKSLSLLRK